MVNDARASLAIKGKWVLAADGAQASLQTERWVVIENDRIAAVTPERPRDG